MPKPPDHDLTDLVARALSTRAGLAAAYLYGSAARGEATSLSDVDIALLFSEELSEKVRRNLIVEIASDLARAGAGDRLDVRDSDELPLVVQGRILTEGRLIRSDDDVRRVRFETSVRMQYFDFLPFHRRDVEEGLRSLRRRSVVDAGRLRALLTRIGDRRARLARYAERSLGDYLADEEGVLASKYLFVTAIEDALSVANHVIAAEGLRSPADYADAFRVLAKRGIIETALSRRLEWMARFRNLLIHVYAEVDDQRVHRYLSEDLADLDAFVTEVLAAFPEVGRAGAS